jgi:hypothetical protein
MRSAGSRPTGTPLRGIISTCRWDLAFADFEAKVKGMTQANVYSALQEQERILGSTASTRPQKVEALKFIVHFVGDLHQPMHVSREEDKGGNTIQLNYDGNGTNLHALWDSKLIDHQGLTYEQMAEKYDHATPAQIKQWQSDPLIQWIWESYQASSKLYAEVDANEEPRNRRQLLPGAYRDRSRTGLRRRASGWPAC